MQIQEVVGHIEAGDLLPPLVVLHTLAKNPRLKVGLIKEYIARHVRAETERIEDDRRQIEQYQEETRAMREQIHELKTKAGLPAILCFRLPAARSRRLWPVWPPCCTLFLLSRACFCEAPVLTAVHGCHNHLARAKAATDAARPAGPHFPEQQVRGERSASRAAGRALFVRPLVQLAQPGRERA